MASETPIAPQAARPGAGPPTIKRAGPPSGHGDPMARAVGLVLQWGVVLAASITAVGGAVFLRLNGSEVPHFESFRGVPAPLSTIGGVLREARAGDGAALVQSGLLVLIATPVARVAMLFVGFARTRNWIYVVLSAVVLGALVAGVIQTH